MKFLPTLASISNREGRRTCDLEAGETIAGKYLLLESLGAGGMGHVWSATNTATEAEVALKIVHPALAGAADSQVRFRREAAALASLSHRSVVRAFDLVETKAGDLVLVMERLRGETLAERLGSEGACSVRDTLRFLLPVLSGLAHAHACGVVHRDLKPANIFLAVEPDGAICPKLVDFGISTSRRNLPRLTLRGVAIGTPGYMAPEQAAGGIIDARSDVFGAGVVLYECLAGVHPFASDSIPGFIAAVLTQDPDRIRTLPRKLWAVLAKALAKSPADRYANALELMCALEAAAPHDRATVGPRGTTGTSPRAASRIFPLAVACLVGALGMLAATHLSPSRLPPMAPTSGSPHEASVVAQHTATQEAEPRALAVRPPRRAR